MTVWSDEDVNWRFCGKKCHHRAFVLIDKALLTIGSDRDVFGHTESPLNGRARIFVASIAHVEDAFIW